MRKYLVLSLLVLATSAQAEYDAYKLKAAYQLCGILPLNLGSFEILKGTVLEEQPKLAMAMAGGENIKNPPRKAEMDSCNKALIKFRDELTIKTKELKDAKAKG